MGSIQSAIKAVVVPEKVKGGELPLTFSEALEQGIIAATPDAKVVLLTLDQEAQNQVPSVALGNDNGERAERRYDFRVIHKQMHVGYLINFGHHLLDRGWRLFLDYNTFLSFLCRDCAFACPVGYERISVPVQVGGRLKAMTVAPGKDGVLVVDIHPTAYAEHMLYWPLERGETILLLR